MVRSGVPGLVEHFAAYAATGSIAMAGYGPSQGSARVIGALSLYAGLLEWLQHFSPGRHPAIEDFAASALGALCGAIAFALLGRWLRGRLQD